MTDVVLMKTPTGMLAPVDDVGADYISKLKMGYGVRLNLTRVRNPRFHKKVFALFQLAFEAWEAPVLEYKGEQVSKEFEQFRKDITVIAGHHNSVVNLRGEVRLVAKSLAFASMDDEEFERVYKSVLEATWKNVLRNHGYKSSEEVESVIKRLTMFE